MAAEPANDGIMAAVAEDQLMSSEMKQNIQDLPRELRDEIFDLYLRSTNQPDTEPDTTTIAQEYKPPRQLSISRTSRQQAIEYFYGGRHQFGVPVLDNIFVFHHDHVDVDPVGLASSHLLRWLTSLSASACNEINTILLITSSSVEMQFTTYVGYDGQVGDSSFFAKVMHKRSFLDRLEQELELRTPGLRRGVLNLELNHGHESDWLTARELVDLQMVEVDRQLGIIS